MYTGESKPSGKGRVGSNLQHQRKEGKKKKGNKSDNALLPHNGCGHLSLVIYLLTVMTITYTFSSSHSFPVELSKKLSFLRRVESVSCLKPNVHRGGFCSLYCARKASNRRGSRYAVKVVDEHLYLGSGS